MWPKTSMQLNYWAYILWPALQLDSFPYTVMFELRTYIVWILAVGGSWNSTYFSQLSNFFILPCVPRQHMFFWTGVLANQGNWRKCYIPKVLTGPQCAKDHAELPVKAWEGTSVWAMGIGHMAWGAREDEEGEEGKWHIMAFNYWFVCNIIIISLLEIRPGEHFTH